MATKKEKGIKWNRILQVGCWLIFIFGMSYWVLVTPFLIYILVPLQVVIFSEHCCIGWVCLKIDIYYKSFYNPFGATCAPRVRQTNVVNNQKLLYNKFANEWKGKGKLWSKDGKEWKNVGNFGLTCPNLVRVNSFDNLIVTSWRRGFEPWFFI